MAANGDFYEINESGSIINFDMSFEDGTDPFASLHVHRRLDWGWEFRSNLCIIRSVEHRDVDKLWNDYSSCLVVEKRKKGVVINRGTIKYNRREVPDIPEIKEFLRLCGDATCIRVVSSTGMPMTRSTAKMNS